MSPGLALGQSASLVLMAVARLVGLAVVSGLLAGAVALVYRWYVRERVPAGLALLFALAGVAVVLNTTPLLAAEIAADGQDLVIVDALFNIAAFVGSAAVAFAGIRAGDRLGTDVFVANGTGRIDTDVSEIVQTVGRVTRVQLPDDIDDVVGYDPVPDATKETLAGRRFLFPRRLTKAELRDRLVSRLKTDHGVGHVDVEIDDDGTVQFLAVGSRAAGIGPTLPPATNAVAIRADPAHAASAGDLVQVWETDPTKRVLTGELRGVAGDVVTVAIDAAETPRLHPTEQYRLVTLPVQDRPDREFASLLRAADETLTTITVEHGSDLDGATLEGLNVTVAAITREGETTEPLPARSRTLHAGDAVYAIATPELLRKLERAADGQDGVAPDAGATPVETTDGSSGTATTAADRDRTTATGTDLGAAETDLPTGDAFADADDAPGDDAPGDDADGDVATSRNDASSTDADGDDSTGSDATGPDVTGEDVAGDDLAETDDESTTDTAGDVPQFGVDGEDPLADPFDVDADGEPGDDRGNDGER